MKKFSQVIIFLVFLSLIPSIGCAHYSGGPWSGKVIDAETKQPIEGAVVVAVWYETFAAIPESSSRFKAAKEVITDSKGEFRFSKQSYSSFLPDGEIVGPHFTIFKPGYGYFPAQHVYPKDWDNDYFIKPGAVVELPKWKTINERREKLPSEGEPGTKNLKIYMKLLNQERIDIGYKPLK